jgi:hypothetical protein
MFAAWDFYFVRLPDFARTTTFFCSSMSYRIFASNKPEQRLQEIASAVIETSCFKIVIERGRSE